MFALFFILSSALLCPCSPRIPFFCQYLNILSYLAQCILCFSISPVLTNLRVVFRLREMNIKFFSITCGSFYFYFPFSASYLYLYVNIISSFLYIKEGQLAQMASRAIENPPQDIHLYERIHCFLIPVVARSLMAGIGDKQC